MATTSQNSQISIVDSSGNVTIIYPKTYASLVSLDSINSYIGSSYTTVQQVIALLRTGAISTRSTGSTILTSGSTSTLANTAQIAATYNATYGIIPVSPASTHKSKVGAIWIE